MRVKYSIYFQFINKTYTKNECEFSEFMADNNILSNLLHWSQQFPEIIIHRIEFEYPIVHNNKIKLS